MAKIRKQPRRSTKKINQVLLDNPFLDEDYYQHFIPNQIYNSLTIFQQISITNLDDYVPEFPQASFQLTIDSMRKALLEQENRISEIKNHQLTPNYRNQNYSAFQLSINSNVQQTKKTVNNTQAGMFPDQDGLFNFCDLQDSIMKKKKQHEEILDYVDWSFLASRKDQQNMSVQGAGINIGLFNSQEDESPFQINMIL